MKALAFLAFLLVLAALWCQLYLGAGLTWVASLGLASTACLLLVALLACRREPYRGARRGVSVELEDELHRQLLAAATFGQEER